MCRATRSIARTLCSSAMVAVHPSLDPGHFAVNASGETRRLTSSDRPQKRENSMRSLGGCIPASNKNLSSSWKRRSNGRLFPARQTFKALLSFATALSGVVRTGRPVASFTIAAAGAMLYCASANVTAAQVPGCLGHDPIMLGAIAAIERGHRALGELRHDLDRRGKSRGIDASVGGKVESRPILRPCSQPARSSPRWA